MRVPFVPRLDCTLARLAYCGLRAQCHAGMVAGALLLGVHMAMTHGVSLGMLAAHIPSHALPGLGPVGGTCWSLTDLLLGGWVGGWVRAQPPGGARQLVLDGG